MVVEILTSYHPKIKHQHENLLWNAEPPVIPHGVVRCPHFPCFFLKKNSIQIKLRPADGRATERWILTPSRRDLGQEDYNERWELLQRIGRFLGQF